MEEIMPGSSDFVGETVEFDLGEEAWIDCCVRKGKNLFGISTALVYDSDLLEIVLQEGAPIVSAGSFFNPDGNRLDLLASLENDEQGILVVGLSRTNMPIPLTVGVTGDGVFFSVRFKTIGEGEGMIAFGPESQLMQPDGKATRAKFSDLAFQAGVINIVYFTVRRNA